MQPDRHRIIRGHEQPALRACLLGICTWEQVALSTGVVPSISSCVWRRPPLLRAAIAVGVGVALFDHFVTRRWL